MTLPTLQRATAALAVTLLSLSAQAGPDVSVSVGIHQPGVYGRIEIGNRPPPPVILPQPIVIVPGPVAVHQRPLYLYVPPGHQKKWDKHCHRYAACGQPVYFVQESWVVERHREHQARSSYRHDDRRDDRRVPPHGKRDKHERHDGHPGKGHGKHRD